MRKSGDLKQVKNRGMTLVELIVTFALLSIFLVCATMLMSKTIESYYAAKASSYGMEVSGILNDWLSGQLESAANVQLTMTTSEDDTKVRTAMLIESDRVEFTNRDGSHVELKVRDGYLCEHYYSVVDADTGAEQYQEVEWAFDAKTYMGYTISEIEFSAAGSGYPDNVLCVRLHLTNGTYGDYETTAYIQCYNLEDSGSMKFLD